MTAMLTADWFLLGRDTYYRKFEIYSMKWHQDLNMDNVVVSGCSYGGPIAVIRDGKKFVKLQGSAGGTSGSGKPVIAIYTGSGHQISSVVWTRGQPVAFGWSESEHLLCVQVDGSVCMHDMFGNYRHTFNVCLEPRYEASQATIIDARIFPSAQGTGVAVMTTQFRLLLVNNVHDPKRRRMCDLPPPVAAPSSWCVLPGERHTRLLVARGHDIYRMGEEAAGGGTPDLVCCAAPDGLAAVRYTAIIEMAVSSDGAHLALLTDAGHLWLGTSDARTRYRPLVECATVGGGRRQLAWCGSDAAVLCAGRAVYVYGRFSGDTVTYAYDSAVHLVPEIDAVRILSGSQHELLQRVPPVVQKIFRINSTAPGSFLLEASKQYQRRSHRADEYVSLVRGSDLETAVAQCVEAAGHEFDTDTQKMLVRAAQFGKCFMPQLDQQRRGGGHDGVTVAYVAVCRRLRVLNAVRDERIGVPLTCAQLARLSYEPLLDRLVARKHFYLAIQVARFLRLSDARILARWAGYKVAGAARGDDGDDVAVARQIADRLGGSGVSFSEIARAAAECGRKRLAIGLLEHEPRAGRQVPLLLRLGECRPALLRAIDSGDTDLVYTVVLHMRDNMPLADFRMAVRGYPVAQALYKKYCRWHNDGALSEIHVQEDDFGAQADESVRVLSLTEARDLYRRARLDAHAAVCDEAARLVAWRSRRQRETASALQTGGVGGSLHDECAALLDAGDLRAAERLRADFRMPERRFWWLRVRSLAARGEWPDLERLSRTKRSPVGYGPFVDVCLEHDNRTEAVKYLGRVADDLKVRYYMRVGLSEDAARIAYEQKSVEGLLYVQRRCATDAHIVEKINSYVAALARK